MANIKRIPKEVLDLFPQWEYRCPKCKKYVVPPVNKCPICGLNFEEKKWRVPPRFLKSYEAMSQYAHKVLASKLNEKQRQLLFKYFTTIFEDGFESGDFSNWSGTTESDGSITVESTDPYQGTYHAEASISTGTNVRRAYCYKTGLDEGILYMRQYVKFLDHLTEGDDDEITVMYARGTGAIFQV